MWQNDKKKYVVSDDKLTDLAIEIKVNFYKNYLIHLVNNTPGISEGEREKVVIALMICMRE
jgi:hypothetical protein